MRRDSCPILRTGRIAIARRPRACEARAMETLSEIAALIARHASAEGLQSTPFERLHLVRSSTTTMPVPTVYQPLLCLSIQGRKVVAFGDREFAYAPGGCGIVTHDLPVAGRIVEATRERPYLSLVLHFDPVALGELALRVPPPAGEARPLGLTVTEAGAELLHAALRLLRLHDDPQALAVLAPAAEQEILYRLLTGPHGARMRRLTAGHGAGAQVGRAIAWIRARVRERITVEEVARAAGMSPSSLHAHFRAVTAMTPLQFHKQLRLQDARHLMLVDGLDATTAAFRVGYESASQFSREYRRQFGEPPARDVARLRTSPELALVA